MAYQAIPGATNLHPGDKLKFHFEFFDILYIYRPSKEDIADAANQAAGFSVIQTSYNTLSGLAGESGYIEGKVTEEITADEIADDIRQQLMSFKTVTGFQITSIERDSISTSDFKPSIPTTISLAAVAIIFLVIAFLVLKFD